jgi:hypothetical protein
MAMVLVAADGSGCGSDDTDDDGFRDQVLRELWTTVPVLEGLTDPERRELRHLLQKTAQSAPVG